MEKEKEDREETEMIRTEEEDQEGLTEEMMTEDLAEMTEEMTEEMIGRIDQGGTMTGGKEKTGGTGMREERGRTDQGGMRTKTGKMTETDDILAEEKEMRIEIIVLRGMVTTEMTEESTKMVIFS